MARTRLTVTGITHTGVDAPQPASADTSQGNSADNPDGRTILVASNTGATPHTLTLRITTLVDGQSVTPRTWSIPAGATRYLGVFHTVHYSTSLQLDADSDELALAALRFGPTLPGDTIDAAGPFSLDGIVVRADLDFAGLTADGLVLEVDTALTSSTVDGLVLQVTA